MAYRSGLEERVARWMKLNGFDNDYESVELPYQIESIYNPDFILPNGVILEVKGWFKPADRRKMLAVKMAHPHLDIRFVFQNHLSPISKGSKTTYALWCEKNGFPYCSAKEIPLEWFN